jgi:hypothetical protein
MTLAAGTATVRPDLSAGVLSTVVAGARPPIWIVGTPPRGATINLQVLFETTGLLGTVRFRWGLNGGVSWEETNVLTPVNNVTTGMPPVGKPGWGEYLLGATGLTARFPPATYAAGDAFSYVLQSDIGRPIVTGTGLARALVEAEAQVVFSKIAPVPLPDPDSSFATVLRGGYESLLETQFTELADRATRQAAAIVTYFVQNTVVVNLVGATVGRIK